MSRSRWGGFRRGRNKIFNLFNIIKSPSAPVQTPTIADITTDFSYVYSQGIWDLTSTNQFPKQSGGGTGLTASLLNLSGSTADWTQRTVDISAYAGSTVRVVFHAVNGGGFSADVQLDQIDLDGNIYSFENQTHGFETSATSVDTYNTVTWNAVAVEEGNAGAWQVDTGGTPSGTTGRADAANGTYYIYTEASAPADTLGYNFWLRSPEVVLGNNPTLTFFEVRTGDNIGSLDVYLEVIA